MGILFQMSLITFPNFVFLNLVLRLPSLRKLQLVIVLNFLSVLFLQELSDLTWDSTLSAKDPSKSFSTFYNKLNKLLNKHTPLRTLSKRKSKQLAKPWITKGLRKAIHIKNELPYSGDRGRYKLYRNKVLLLSRISKSYYLLSHLFWTKHYY